MSLSVSKGYGLPSVSWQRRVLRAERFRMEVEDDEQVVRALVKITRRAKITGGAMEGVNVFTIHRLRHELGRTIEVLRTHNKARHIKVERNSWVVTDVNGKDYNMWDDILLAVAQKEALNLHYARYLMTKDIKN